MNRIDRLLARKAELTPGLVMATPHAPFPWYPVPYVHGTMEPNASYAGGAITTDELGLRRVDIHGRLMGFQEFQRLAGKKKLLLGASTAFSMGASSDRTTIASQLSRISGQPWFAPAMVSYVSIQEVMLYHLLQPRDIDELVILSGLNTLTAALLTPPSALEEVFSPNFFTQPGRPAPLARKVARYTRTSLAMLFNGRTLTQHHMSLDEPRVELALRTLRRDLEALQSLAASRGVRVTFCLQPVLSVLQKPRSSEEQEIVHIQEVLGRYTEFVLWGVYGSIIPQCYRAFSDRLERLCRELGLRYVDVNRSPSAFEQEGWLFADQTHFTDEGCRVCAEAIHHITTNGGAR